MMEITKRIDLLDYLRGFALMGILLVNIGPLLEINSLPVNSADAVYWQLLNLLVEGRFYTIFTFLFGIGFYIFMNRAQARGKNGYALYLRRLALLFTFGLLHVQFHPGEALTVYAISGLLILPFYKANKLFNLICATLMLIGLAIFSFKLLMVVPLMILGIAAAQYGFLTNTSPKKMITFTLIMFVFSGMGLLLQAHYAPFAVSIGNQKSNPASQQFYHIGIAIGPIISAFYVGMAVLLLQQKYVRKLLLPLKSYGRMALTNYVGQTFLIHLFGYILQFYSDITLIETLYICLVIYIIQLTISTVWMKYFHFGPLEWVWRMGTYGKIPPMRR
ncbi:DUF418 domain-containing protein [Bacillus rubiinfantis]|uniref:DUF418 domain-containing protein n=1 Tax=Bacillus rubiinfantis TaxID=1499680 RepID=UPI0005A8868A|nr:DUF418 domain-containing protein [Bacillus rubiinfantis]